MFGRSRHERRSLGSGLPCDGYAQPLDPQYAERPTEAHDRSELSQHPLECVEADAVDLDVDVLRIESQKPIANGSAPVRPRKRRVVDLEDSVGQHGAHRSKRSDVREPSSPVIPDPLCCIRALAPCEQREPIQVTHPPTTDVFDKVRLPRAVDAYLREANPWWQGLPGRVLPPYRRWVFDTLVRRVDAAVAPAIVLRGARQVGKTTLLEQMIDFLIREREIDPRQIFRVQFDELPPLRDLSTPILDIVRWYQNRILECTLNEAAHAGRPVYIFLDEVQNLRDWAPQLKALVDHHTVQVVVTGSSALRIEAGRDSLAGRIASLELGTLLLREIIGLRLGSTIEPLLALNGTQPLAELAFWRAIGPHGDAHRAERDEAFAIFSERGGYPLVHARPRAEWPELADQLNETVIRRVIQHDLRMGDRGRRRDQALLEEVFRLACRYAGQAPGQAKLVAEIRHALSGNVGWQRVLSYLKFLDGSLLMRMVRPLELRLKKTRGPSKLCIVDHGLRASWLEESIPVDPGRLEQHPHLTDLAGHIAESIAGVFLTSIPGLDVAHFPERPTEPEVDFVLTIGEHRIPVEIKYRRRIDAHRDTLGLRSFLEKTHYHAPFGVLVTMLDGVEIPDPRIVPVSLRSLLLIR